MSAPLLTILMPTLDAATYLEEALESIRTGTLPAGEVDVLVLDGGSRDGTHAIAGRFAPLARLSVEPDGGLYQALNRGLGQARGQYIGWLNADDRFTPEGPAALLAALDSSLDFAYGDYQDWDLARNIHTLVRHQDDALEHYRRGEMRLGWVTPLAMVWRRTTLQRLGGWNPRYRISGDQELWVRAACVQPMLRGRHVDEVIGIFRTHRGSLSSGRQHLGRMRAEELWLSDTAVRHPDLSPAMLRAFRRRRSDCVRWSVWAEVLHGRFGAARELVRHYGEPGDSVLALLTAHLLDAGGRRLRRLSRGSTTSP